MSIEDKIRVSKEWIYKHLFFTSCFIIFGGILDAIAIKSNNVWMPISYPKEAVNMYYLTDIIPFGNYFFSIGDFIIFFGLVYAYFQIKKVLKLKYLK